VKKKKKQTENQYQQALDTSNNHHLPQICGKDKAAQPKE
jgi:hypothetical protein